jgi:hypothetical protein
MTTKTMAKIKQQKKFVKQKIKTSKVDGKYRA